MNIAVIKLKYIIKYIMYFIIVIAIISFGKNISKKEEFDKLVIKDKPFKNLKNSSFLYCLKNELTFISFDEKKEETKIANKNKIEKILNIEIPIMENIEDKEDFTEINQEENNQNEEKQEEKIEIANENVEAKENVETQVIDDNNIKATYTNNINNIKINNQTGFNINEILENPQYEITNKNKVIIYHTHTCESYTSSDIYKYNMTGNYRTTDLNYTVSKVGDELAKNLEGYGKTIIHDKTYHDYPAYNGSYGRSLSTMENILKDNKDAEIMIDLHRDAVRK